MKPDKVTVLLAVALGAFGSTVHRDVARQEPVRAGPVSYTHLDVYKRQPYEHIFIEYLMFLIRQFLEAHESCLLYTSRCV